MSVKVELLSADKVVGFFEKLVRTYHPEVYAERKKQAAEYERKARRKERAGVAVTRYSPVRWGQYIGEGKVVGSDYFLGLNRNISEARVHEYAAAMAEGRWWFTPDPIVATDGGRIINGQHRLAAAASGIKWNGEVPEFVVVWGVDKKAALLMDEARRSTNDRRDIALKYAGSVVQGRTDG